MDKTSAFITRKEIERHRAQEAARIAQQRAAFERLPKNTTRRLKLLMLERIWWLCDSGEAPAADALAEFLPEADVLFLFEKFFETREEFDPLWFK